MKPIKFTSQWGKEYNIKFVKGKYQNNKRLAIQCWCEDKEYGGWEPYCSVTVNINDLLPKGNCGFLDENNGDPKLFKLMYQKGYMEMIDDWYGVSGMCCYQAVKFSDEFLEMIEEIR